MHVILNKHLAPLTVGAALLLAGLAGPAFAQTASSLKQVPALIKSPEGKAHWNEQMVGQAAPDGLGKQLPAGLTREALLALLLPPELRARAGLVGAKPWPRRPGSLVAIACVMDRPATPSDRNDCKDYSRGNRVTAYVAVLDMAADGSPRLVAASGPVTATTTWNGSGLPAEPIVSEEDPQGRVLPESWSRFDLANFRLSRDTTAFGLRAGWSQSYSGGGATFEALYLFIIDGDRLRTVLAEPMFAFEDIAGDWHPDGTRDHDISEGRRVLVITPRVTQGFFDVQLKADGEKSRDATTLRWSAADKAYR